MNLGLSNETVFSGVGALLAAAGTGIPAWMIAGGVLGAGLFAAWLGRRAIAGMIVSSVSGVAVKSLTDLATNMFEAKSVVLRDAEAEVHAIEEVDERLLSLEERQNVPEGSRILRIEFTLCPSQTREGPFQMYEPAEMDIVPFAADTSREHVCREDVSIDDVVSAVPIRITPINDDGTPARETMFDRAQRYEGLYACPAALSGRCKFRYYFESIGDMQLPEPSETDQRIAA